MKVICGNNPFPIIAHNYTAKSCLDHMKHGASHCGFYVIDDGDEQYTVFCDINSEVGAAYTLVESFALQHNKKGFRKYSFTQSFPVNHNSPRWDYYRLTKERMLKLSEVSTHWRATCNYPEVGLDYHDYVRVKMSELNPVTYAGTFTCKTVELIQLRGRLEFELTVPFYQHTNVHIFTESSKDACQMKATPNAVNGEDNWGYYGTINPKFRCTSSPQSTTQFWFGGYL